MHFCIIQEISLLHELRHPNVVLLKDCILDQNRVWLIFEYVEQVLLHTQVTLMKMCACDFAVGRVIFSFRYNNPQQPQNTHIVVSCVTTNEKLQKSTAIPI